MIFVILPAYNERASVEPLFKRLLEVSRSASLQLELILVDDGSEDDTIEHAQRVATSLGLSLTVEEHGNNRGLGQALKTGMIAFLSRARDGDFACTMDCDDTQPPELIPSMLQLCEGKNFDLVIASRYRPGAKVVGLSLHRLFLSHGASILFRLFAPITGVKDYTSGFRLYRYKFVSMLLDRYGDSLFTERGFSCMSDLLLKSRSLKPRIAEVGMVLRYDQKPTASKMKLLRTILNTLKILLQHWHRNLLRVE